MQHWHRPIDNDELRRMLRTACGSTIGFLLCKWMDWNYGVFYTVFPILLLAMMPTFNWKLMKQTVAASVVCSLQTGIIAGVFGGLPVQMTLLTFVMFAFWFLMISRGLMAFGCNGALFLSVMLHFGSYPEVDVNELMANNIWASIVASVIAAVLMQLIPPRQAPKPPPGMDKNRQRVRHEVLMGATVATISFIFFQVIDLKDSLSAQVTTILMLFPMHWSGSLAYARMRATGTLIGVVFGLFAQMVVFTYNDSLLLYAPLLWMGIFWFCHAHLKEGRSSGIGFSAMTTTGILFGQYLAPGDDMVFSALYRFSSVFVAALLALIAVYAVHWCLNCFAATRFLPETTSVAPVPERKQSTENE